MKITNTTTQALVQTAERVIVELELKPINNSYTNIPYSFDSNSRVQPYSKQDIYRLIMQHGHHQPERVNTIFVDKVMKQICYFLRYSDLC